MRYPEENRARLTNERHVFRGRVIKFERALLLLFRQLLSRRLDYRSVRPKLDKEKMVAGRAAEA